MDKENVVVLQGNITQTVKKSKHVIRRKMYGTEKKNLPE